MWRLFRKQYGNQHYYFFGPAGEPALCALAAEPQPTASNDLTPAVNVMVRDASLVREINITHAEAFEKPPFYMRVLGPLVGKTSLLLADTDSHRRIRRVASAAFQFPIIRSFAPVMAQLAVRFADGLLPAGERDWHEVEISGRLSSLTLGIITSTALATEGSGSGREVSHRIGAIVTNGMVFLMASALNMTLFIPGWLRVSGAG